MDAIQTFEATTSPDQGPPRLAALRGAMAEAGLAGMLTPRADAWQGENVAPCDERLAWLTGFTGSAGFCAVLTDRAGIFIDGRYRVQVRQQVDPVFTPVHWPETGLADWLKEHCAPGAKIGFDPWLHTVREMRALRRDAPGIEFVATPHPIDGLWHDRPARPTAPAVPHPIEMSGQRSPDKRAACAEELEAAGVAQAVITLPDSICWLLNIRGADIPRTPTVQAFAVLHATGKVDLFIDPAKVADLGPDPDIAVHPFEAFEAYIATLEGPVRIDPVSAPSAVATALGAAGVRTVDGQDPCVLPKARKNPVELEGTRAAHHRDAVAMVEFLAWLDAQDPTTLSEIDVVRSLEGFRRATNALRDISFETISGAGPNGAIVHYRVTEESNRQLAKGELLLVDSGGQYVDGTTDITRTIALGTPPAGAVAAFTRVLRGMIALSRLRFPKGLAGRDIDAIARAPLWAAGQDYDHGTGHGVGSYLGVHEGPASISRRGTVRLDPGMILSNEPGYYREGAFGIRIENLIVVQEAAPIAGGDDRDMLDFETLTYVPIDTRLIDAGAMDAGERGWLNAYHTEVAARLEGRLSDRAAQWLVDAVKPI